MPTSTNFKPTEKELFEMLINSDSVENIRIQLHEKGLNEDSITSLLDNHFYLSPKNILYGQWLIGLFIISITIALTVVRTGTDFLILFFVGLLATLVSSPFFVFAFLIKRNFSLNSLKTLTIVSMVYFFIISIVFIIYFLAVGLFGLILIPTALSIFYFLEIAKLKKLLIYLDQQHNNGI